MQKEIKCNFLGRTRKPRQFHCQDGLKDIAALFGHFAVSAFTFSATIEIISNMMAEAVSAVI